MTFFHAFSGVFSLLLVVALGFFLGRAGWFPMEVRKLLPKLVTNVSLPPFLACTIISSFERGSLVHMLKGPLMPLLAMCMLFVGAYLIARIIGVQKKHFGLFCVCVSNPNTIFIGIPVNQALFGPESLQYVLLYYFASTFFFWTVGNYFISRDGQERGAGSKAEKYRFQWKNLISAPILGFICGVTIVFLDLEVPGFLFRSCMIVGEMTTPLALIFIGITIEGIGLRNLRIGKDVVAALIGRMVLSPLLVAILLPFFGLPELMGKVFIIQSSLPVLMAVAILSAYYDTDPDFGSVMVSVSTMLSVITIPIYMILL